MYTLKRSDTDQERHQEKVRDTTSEDMKEIKKELKKKKNQRADGNIKSAETDTDALGTGTSKGRTREQKLGGTSEVKTDFIFLFFKTKW